MSLPCRWSLCRKSAPSTVVIGTAQTVSGTEGDSKHPAHPAPFDASAQSASGPVAYRSMVGPVHRATSARLAEAMGSIRMT
jgi:hypothetical protein